jgi:ubiquinone/menaquinone biosynthesis C-methylase UbiE
MLGAITRVMDGTPITQASVVDVGCGTGNYAAILSPFVGRVTGVEYNEGMLEQATKKTSHLSNVTVVQGSALNIPLASNTYDAVICTQVLHHLPGSVAPDYAGPVQFIKEAYRILKDRGVLIINTCNEDQWYKSIYNNILIPQAAKKVYDKYPPVDVLIKAMEGIGFTLQSLLSHCHESIMPLDKYKDIQGVLSKEWRNTMSMWAMATEEEIEAALDNWRKMIDNGTIEAFIDNAEKSRKTLGQTTTIVAYKQL